jgi:uncharacterized protein YecE (DUF72 family)
VARTKRKPTPPAAKIHVGTAGWTLPRAEQPTFAAEGTHLQRYAGQFGAVEINSSFHRPHRPATYSKWAASVPAEFRFAVKVPKTITHKARLNDVEPLLSEFLAQANGLGERLGCLLVQLPPSLAFEAPVARAFFQLLREQTAVNVVCEPRHASWFTPAAEKVLVRYRVARVAADPAPTPGAETIGGWPAIAYVRLHGSPRVYYSTYSDDYLDALAERLQQLATTADEVWCIFDNTALGAATRNALDLQVRLQK